MRSVGFVVIAGVLGCATGGASLAPERAVAVASAKPAQPVVKKEVIVIGRGDPTQPGEVSIAPKDQGTDFVSYHGHKFRCTKMNPPPRDPEESEYCREILNGESRNPDPGRLERSKTQAGWH